jgi:hypothetical protein
LINQDEAELHPQQPTAIGPCPKSDSKRRRVVCVSIEDSRTSYGVHIPEDFNLQEHHCANLKWGTRCCWESARAEVTNGWACGYDRTQVMHTAFWYRNLLGNAKSQHSSRDGNIVTTNIKNK